MLQDNNEIWLKVLKKARIGSIEKVFKDFLPELTDNVRTISDIVEKMKKDERK